MSTARVARFVILVCLLAPMPANAQSSAPVELIVRVFDELDEVTAHCQITVYAADTRDAPLVLDLRPGIGHYVEVEPGLYDLQITWRGPGDTVAIEWAEHLSVLWYPDEGGRHVEIVNLQPVFGALLVQPPVTWLETDRDWRVSAFLHGGVGRAGFEAVDGTDHRLFILPAGRYDLVASLSSTELTVTDVEVPAQRTRLKLLELQ
jgi:hypothetical protein